MNKNMGVVDKITRIVVAIIMALFVYTGKVEGSTAIIMEIIAGIFVLTSLVSFCPLYAPFKIKTCKKK